MGDELKVLEENISNKIYNINRKQVMLDRDLAEFYQTTTRTLKQAVRRNIDRFPNDFMFELTENDIEYMVSQSVIPSKSYFGGAKPFVFTEQGISMLASVIKNPISVEMSIKIIRAFVEMRKFITINASLFQRMEKMEQKQFETDKKIERILGALENDDIHTKQGIFYNGQIFDAYEFVIDIIKKAEKSIYVIDNYVDESVLVMFSKNKKIKFRIYTKNISEQLKLDVKKYNSQYKNLEVINFSKSHDRFLIVDEKQVYHIGASLKDLGKKWFAFSKLDNEFISILDKLK